MKKTRILCTFLISILLVPMLVPMDVKAAQNRYTHLETFSTDHQLQGLFASCEEYFQGGEWDVEEASLKLYYKATNLVKEEVSDFTISVNGQPVYSERITLSEREIQELVVSIPNDLIKNGPNSVSVSSYVRTNETDPCKDDVSDASWMTVLKESNISIKYRPTTVCRNVADVYKQMMSIEGLENKECGIYIPQNPTDNELTNAALLLSGISSGMTVDYENMSLESRDMSVNSMDKKYGVYLSEWDKLPKSFKEQLSENQKQAAKEAAIIVFMNTADNNDLLLVTGTDAKAVENACRLFGNKEYLLQTRETWRKITATDNVVKADKEDETKQLTQNGNKVEGPFKQNIALTVEMNANSAIATKSQATLYFRYAENLDFNRSLVTVYIGDVPLGSKKLQKENAGGDTLTVSIPDNLDITGNFILNVTFDLEIPDLECTVRRQDMPWAYISSESSISLHTKEVDDLLFDYYPSPFIKNGQFGEVVVVLPENENADELDAMRQVLLGLGRYLTSNGGLIRVCHTNTLGDVSNADVISIGSLSRNPIVSDNNEQLFFRFSSKGSTILSNEKMRIDPNYGATLGTAQMIQSPYSLQKRALLIISGIKDEGMLQAIDYLGDTNKRWYIYGDGFVADEENIYCYRFGPDNKKQESMINDLKQQSDLLILVVVGSGFLMLMLLATVLLFRKHRNE